ncbi:MAG: RluA family pseudouridine synthase [Planctomycetota bacterium]|jgi:RluA family pseudouridine synthase
MAKPIIEIIHEDDDIIVINKPSGVSVTADRGGGLELAEMLSRQPGLQKAGRLRLVHRLDKGTSGVMVLALNAQTQSTLTAYFQKGLVKKTYLALVTGVVTQKQGTIDAPLAQSRKKAHLMRVDPKRGKGAVTHWRLLADFDAVRLLAVNPVTGRTHQIRVHLASIGLPLAIDRLYGSSKPLFLSDFKADYHLGKGRSEKPLIERLTLHAYQIELPQKRQDHPACFVARLDKKFAATIKMLTKHNPKGFDAFAHPDNYSSIISGQSL